MADRRRRHLLTIPMLNTRARDLALMLVDIDARMDEPELRVVDGAIQVWAFGVELTSEPLALGPDRGNGLVTEVPLPAGHPLLASDVGGPTTLYPEAPF